MKRPAEIVVNGGQEFVEFDGHAFGLGLQLPKQRTVAFPTLATMQPLLDQETIKKIIASEDFKFGDVYFDSSWITNQNGYGSCASYGGASALEKARVLGGQSRVSLSGDYLYSLVNGGRDRGSMLDDNMRALVNKGVCKRETVPLGGIYRSKYNTQKADAEARRFRGHELYATPDEQSVATALAMRIPVVIAIHVTGRWRSFDSDDILAPANGPGNHCEHLDDIKWSSTHGCFLFRKATSHGVNYSGDGYCWTTWDRHYKTTSRYHMFYGVPSAIEDPQGDNPSIDGGEDRDKQITSPVKLVVASRPGCSWCDKWAANERPKVQAAGYEIVEGDVPGNGVPKFRVIVGKRSETHVGFWSFDEIEATISKLRE